MKQTELFENEGYIPGLSPRDKQIREERERAEVLASLSKTGRETYTSAPGAPKVSSDMVAHFDGDEQAARLYRLLSNGGRYGVIDISDMMRIADPRGVISHLRKKGVEVCDEWCKANGKRYKRYWIKR